MEKVSNVIRGGFINGTNLSQVMELVSIISTNVDWGSFGSALIQKLIENPTETGEKITNFILHSKDKGLAELESLGTVEKVDGLNAYKEEDFEKVGLTVTLFCFEYSDLLKDWSKESAILDLVVCKPEDFGFQFKVELFDFLKKAKEIGLESCPVWSAVEYALKHKTISPSKGRELFFANKEIAIRYSSSNEENDLGIYKRPSWEEPNPVDFDEEFVFIRPRK